MVLQSNKLEESWIPKLPSIYQIEVMSRCNLKCQFCMTGLHYGLPFLGSLDSIDPALFNTIVERDLGGSSFIELQFRGEPTLNKNLNNYVLALRDKVLVGFSTHGGLLYTEHALQAALNSHYITISLDAANKERYESLRVGNKFDQLLTNIDLLIKAKQDHFFPIIDLQLIEFEGFEKEVVELERLIQQRGWSIAGDTLRIRTVKDTQAAWINQQQSGKIYNELCTNPWYSVSIKTNGDVVPCCMVFEDVKELVYGNLTKNSLEEIWNSGKVQKFRFKHRLNQLPQYCQLCYARSPHNLHQNLMTEIFKLKLSKE